MIRLGLIGGLMLVVLTASSVSGAEQPAGTPWSVESLSGNPSVPEYNFTTGIIRATNGFLVKYGQIVLTADAVTGFTTNHQLIEVVADGKVRILQGDQVWASEHLRY